MLKTIIGAIAKEVAHGVDAGVKVIQRRLIRMLLKAFLCVAGVFALAAGLIILGSQYVGLDLMLLLTGVVFLIVFFFL